jgi:hypothetical protein
MIAVSGKGTAALVMLYLRGLVVRGTLAIMRERFLVLPPAQVGIGPSSQTAGARQMRADQA